MVCFEYIYIYIYISRDRLSPLGLNYFAASRHGCALRAWERSLLRAREARLFFGNFPCRQIRGPAAGPGVGGQIRGPAAAPGVGGPGRPKPESECESEGIGMVLRALRFCIAVLLYYGRSAVPLAWRGICGCFLGYGAIGMKSASFYHENVDIGQSALEKYVVLLYFWRHWSGKYVVLPW